MGRWLLKSRSRCEMRDVKVCGHVNAALRIADFQELFYGGNVCLVLLTYMFSLTNMLLFLANLGVVLYSPWPTYRGRCCQGQLRSRDSLPH